MYGLIGKVTVVPGQRDAFAAILLEGGEAMPGCLSYIIAADPADADALWIRRYGTARPATRRLLPCRRSRRRSRKAVR